jgi:hypothetical protein
VVAFLGTGSGKTFFAVLVLRYRQWWHEQARPPPPPAATAGWPRRRRPGWAYF